MTLALEGFRVLEVAYQLPGPYCGMILADMGAEVIKVEQPKGGDPARYFPPYFVSVNRNKRSLTLDLRSPQGVEVFRKLAVGADAIVDGFRPGVAARLGIDYGSVLQINPRVVYCSISGYGQDGPYKTRSGYDVNYQGVAGMLSLAARPGEMPPSPSVTVGDLSSGMFAAISILGALLSREKTGMGQYIDVSMLDSIVSWMANDLSAYFAGHGQPTWQEEWPYSAFEAADGKCLTIGVSAEDRFWNSLCKAVGREELLTGDDQERKAKRVRFLPELRRIMQTKPRDEWLRLLLESDIPCAPMHNLAEVETDPQIIHRQMITGIEDTMGEKLKQVGFPAKFSATPAEVRTPPPALGQHTDEILLGLGYSRDDLVRFRELGNI